ncbi:MAG: hypothetical protein A2V65_09340 [Deltaproteobacteria bacterium RBG_13_49_15]|nr:MAG: hypothetical protein A2V65_09340 [Deltaproteobacteria bacterium RBG_13_49_15]
MAIRLFFPLMITSFFSLKIGFKSVNSPMMVGCYSIYRRFFCRNKKFLSFKMCSSREPGNGTAQGLGD